MNYINRLQSENATLTEEVERLNQGLSDLRSYMCSDKFKGENPEDRMVNSEDILRWIDQIKSGRLV